MNAKIPGYHLQKYHEEVVTKSNLFDPIVKVSLWDCYQNLWLVLYDEDVKKYIRVDELDVNDQITWTDFVESHLFSAIFIFIKYGFIYCYTEMYMKDKIDYYDTKKE